MKYIDSYVWVTFLISNLADLLGNLELTEYLLDEAPDIADNFLWNDYKDEAKPLFNKHFTLFEDIEELQDEIKLLQRKNYNVYYVFLIALFEKHLNFIIDILGRLDYITKKPIKKTLSKKVIEYCLDDENDWCIKKKNYLEKIKFSSIRSKLLFFHNLLGSKKPKTGRFISSSDFEFYSEIRNRILHSNEEMVELHVLPRYEDIREEIFNSKNRVLISKRFFFQAVESLFEICHEITLKMAEKYPLPQKRQ